MLRTYLINFFICCLGFWSVIWCLLKFFWVFFWFVGVWFGLVAVCCFGGLVELLLGTDYSPLSSVMCLFRFAFLFQGLNWALRLAQNGAEWRRMACSGVDWRELAVHP